MTAENTIDYVEIPAKDPAKAQAFFTELFGWQFETSVTKIRLVAFSGDKRPTSEQRRKMHELSHGQCFIANSVTTEVSTEPVS